MATGFIGLGALGSAIAGRLIEQGEELVVWNRTRSKAEALGATIADSPQAVIEQVDTCFLCLFDSDAVQTILTGDTGLLGGSVSGKLIIDLTTNHFEPVTSFHETTANRGAHYLECPVFGSVVPARKGLLTLVASGRREDYDRAKPVLEKFGKNIFHLPAPGAATRMKLVNNLLLGVFMASIAEGVALAEAAGIDKARALEILEVGAGNSLVLTAKKQKLLEEDYSVHFSAEAVHKDLSAAVDLARATGSSGETAAIAQHLFQRVLGEGRGTEDLAVIYDLLKRGNR